MAGPLLDVRDLKKHYPVTEGLLKKEVGRVRAVDGVSFQVDAGETLGLVGESGCGKSTAATTTLRLEEPTGGEVLFDGEDITGYDKAELKRFRRRAQMIFQDPTSSFDPRMSIGESVAEPLRVHGFSDRERRRTIVGNLLERVGMSADDIDRYPHEFSGGQKQRVALARALVVNPDFIVADEPVSALDVSIQAEIISLINDVQEDFGLGILFISHDLGVVREVADRVAVMYLGEIVEVAPTDELFADPQHPYTRALLASIPQPDPRKRGGNVELRGDVPSPSNPPTGCRFHTRCKDIIPPAAYDLGQEEWRAIAKLIVRLEKGSVSREALADLAVAEMDANEGAVTDDVVAQMLRADLGIPESVSDPEAERVVDEAVDHVLAESPADALATLDEAFETPCRTSAPAEIETSRERRVSCHLHDNTVVGEPRETPARTGGD